MTSALEAFGASAKPSPVTSTLFLLLQRFPVLFNIPITNNRLLDGLNKAMEDISKTLFKKAKREKGEGHLEGKEKSSVIGLLSAWLTAIVSLSNLPTVRMEDAETKAYLTGEEVLAQVSK